MPTTRATIETPDRLTSAKVVAGSLVAGCLSAAALVVGPLAVRDEATTTGAILLGFAVGPVADRDGDGKRDLAIGSRGRMEFFGSVSGALLLTHRPPSQRAAE